MLRQTYIHKTLLGCPGLMADINCSSESYSAADDDNKDDTVNFLCTFSLALCTLTHTSI